MHPTYRFDGFLQGGCSIKIAGLASFTYSSRTLFINNVQKALGRVYAMLEDVDEDDVISASSESSDITSPLVDQ
jgi:hypothetical protein